MPLYEYQCQQCRRMTEKIQKFSDAPLTTCPHCGGTLERTLTAPAVQFKGSGWYKDLYSSAKPAAAKPGESANTAPAGESGGGGGAEKPATAAPAAAPAASTSSSSGSTGTNSSGS